MCRIPSIGRDEKHFARGCLEPFADKVIDTAMRFEDTDVFHTQNIIQNIRDPGAVYGTLQHLRLSI